MARTIGVVIATYGNGAEWPLLAERAVASAVHQSSAPEAIKWVHGKDLAHARNKGAAQIDTEYIVFLDADDELDHGYIESMRKALGETKEPKLYQPSTLGIVDGREDAAPVVIPKKPLLDGNYMVIGTMVENEQFHRVGGFRELDAYEDWDLWIRCWLDSSETIVVEDAIYRVHVRPQSRNQLERADAVRIYKQIRDEYQGRVK